MGISSRRLTGREFYADANRFEAEATGTAKTRAHKKLGAGSGLRLRALSQASRRVGCKLRLLFAKLEINLAAKMGRLRVAWSPNSSVGK